MKCYLGSDAAAVLLRCHYCTSLHLDRSSLIGSLSAVLIKHSSALEAVRGLKEITIPSELVQWSPASDAVTESPNLILSSNTRDCSECLKLDSELEAYSR